LITAINEHPKADHAGSGDLAIIIESKRSAWTAEALAALLEISPKTIYKAAKSGRLTSCRLCGLVRFDPKRTAEWLRAKTVVATTLLSGFLVTVNEVGLADSGDLASIIESKRRAWTAEGLAELLEVSTKTIYKEAKSGRLSVIRIGGILRFDPKLTAAWLRSRTAPEVRTLRRAA
jgi:DNA-directed RNA polymerase subunit F